MDSSPSPFTPFRGILEFVAIVASVVIGYLRIAPVPGFLLGFALIEIAYLLTRYPQLLRAWASDRQRIARLLLLQIAANVVVATVAYWLGRGIANQMA